MKLNFLQVWQDLNQSAKIIIAILMIVAIGGVYKSCTTQSSLDKFRKQYESYKDTVAITLQHADSLKAKARQDSLAAEAALAHADSLRKRNAQLSAVNQQLHQRNDSLANVVLSDTTLSSAARTLITGLRTENDSLRSQIVLFNRQDSLQIIATAKLKDALADQTHRADSLENRLRNLPQTPRSDKLLGFIPMPSRTVVFIAGAITGFVLSSRLK